MSTPFLRASRPVLVVAALLPLVASHPVPPILAVEHAAGRLVAIEPNRGQFGPDVAFALRTTGGRVSFAGGRVELPGEASLGFAFLGGADPGTLEPVDPLPGLVHYVPGSDPAGWVTDVPTFAGLLRRQVYPGVDVLFRGGATGLELEFVLAPGADASAVVLDFGRAGAFRLDGEGGAVLESGREAVRIGRPLVERGSAGSLLPAGGTVALRLNAADTAAPVRVRLSMDVALPQRGGSADLPRLATGAGGEAFVAGSLGGVELESDRAGRGEDRAHPHRGTRDVHAGAVPLAERTGAFVTRISGETVLETAWFGTERERPSALATLPGGDVLLAGGAGEDAFVLQLGRSGLRPMREVVIGRTGEDRVAAVAVDGAGEIWLAGKTASPGRGADAWITHLDAELNISATMSMGGSGDDEAVALAFDGNGALRVAGTSDSRDFPVRSPLQAFGGGHDAFLATLDPATGTVAQATFHGGPGDEEALGLAIERDGAVLLLGKGDHPFVSRLAGDGSAVLSTTTLDLAATALALDPAGRPWIAGDVEEGGPADAFVARLSSQTFAPEETHLLAGDREDRAGALLLDGRGTALLTGLTRSDELPGTTRTEPTAGGDVFLARVVPDTEAPQGVCPGDTHWVGPASGGDWATVANWSAGVPTATTDACIQAASVTVSTAGQNAKSLRVEGANAGLTITNGALTLANASEIDAPFTLTNGTLTGAGNVTVSGTFTWSGGTMSGTGTTTANGGLTSSTPFGKTLTRTLVLPAGQSWVLSGSGGIVINTPGVLSNLGTFEHQADGSISGTGTFNNLGTFLRTTSVNNATVSTIFNNTGTVDVQSGELSLQDNGTHTGSFDATGALLRFSGGTQSLSATTSVTGGAVEFTNGTITLNGTYNVTGSTTMTFGTATFASTSTVTSVGALAISNGTMTFNSGETIAPSSLNFGNGTLTGSDAINVAGLFTWGGGTMSGTGTTTADGGIAFPTAFGKTLTRTLVNPAGETAVYTGTGGLVVNTAGVLSNAGTFEQQNDAQISGTGTFNSSGTFLRTTSAGNAIVSCVFNNTGSLDVQSGELSLQDNGAHTGSFDATGALLRFSGGTQTLSAATSVTGTAVEFTNGTITVGGTYNVTGSTTMTFGTVTFSPTSTVTSVGALSLGNGTLTFNSGETIAPSTLSFTNGTLTGSDAITVSGLFTWGGGTMSGAGTTTANGGITFSTAFGKTLTRTLINPGGQTALYTGTGGFVINSPGVLSNAGTFEHQSDAQVSGTGTFNSSGTVLRTTSAGNAVVSCVFNNTGSVDVQTGELSLQDNGTHTGSFDATGTLLRFSGGTQTLSAATTVTGTTVEITNGTITMSGSYNVTGATTMTFGNLTFAPTSTVTSVGALSVSNGTMTFNSGETIAPSTLTFTNGTLTGTDSITATGLFTWGGGTMSGTGTTTANGGIAFTTAFGKTLTRGLVLPATKSAVYTGTGGLVINNPGTFENSGTFDHQTDASISGTGTFNSPGTFLRTTSAGNVAISCPFNNTGTLDVQTGELSLQDNGAHTGSFDATGALLRFSGGTQTLSAATTVTGTAIAVTNGTITVGGSYDVTGTTTMTFGNLTFAPTSTVTSVGALSLSNGTMTFNSGETIAPSTLTFTNGTLTGSDAITAAGLFTWGGGTMSGTGTTTANGGIAFTTAFGKTLTRTLINPAGQTALFSGTGGFVINNPGAMDNSGTFEHQTDAGVSGTGSFDNAGTFQRTTSAGSLSVSVPFDNTGTVECQSGTLAFSGSGAHTGDFVAGPSTILQFSGGTHTFSGTTLFSAPRVEWTGATASFAGTYSVASTLIAFGTLNMNVAATMGTLDFTNGTLSGTGDIVVSALLTWSGGTMSGTGTTATNGGMAMPGATGKTLTRTLNHGNGQTATLSGTGGLNINTPGIFNNEANATFVLSSDCSINGSGTFANAGTFQRTTSPGTAFASVAFTNAGTVEVLSGTFQISGPSYTQTAGSTLLNGGNITNSFPLLIQGGTLGGVGTITGNINNSGGSVAPGLSPGTLTLVGDYTQGGSAAYTVEIGGLVAGTEHDQLVLTNPGFGTGDASLGGDLNVTLVNGFDPAIGSTFTILTMDTRTGTFASTNLPAFGCGKTWNIQYNATSVVLQVVAQPGSSDLVITPFVGPDPVATGDQVTYSPKVGTSGPDDATQVTLVATLPPGAAFVSASAGCSEASGIVTCDMGTIPGGSGSSVSIVVTFAAPGNPSFSSSVTSAECDPNPADNTDRVISLTVLPPCPDGDNDGYAVCTSGVACTPAGGDLCGDCDDASGARHPGATEICDGIDNDCTGGVPANEADGDSDGFRVCENDCNDGNAAVNPGVVEADPLCADAIDNDCDGQTDLNDPSCLGVCPDSDDDGYAVCSAGCAPDAGDTCGDCNDLVGTVHPNATEACNGIDDDCAGGVPANEADGDGDGFRVCENDCNDADPNVHPTATEQCNGVDDDCANGVPADEADGDTDGFRVCQNDCDDADPNVHPNATEACNGVDDDCADGVPADEADGDADGFRVCENDCDDGSPAVHPGAAELCNGIDDDCLGGIPVDENDADGDGFRVCGGDCNDGNGNVHPGATELCNGIDDDCAGGLPADEEDNDGDTVSICQGDCDDGDSTRHPGADELCNGIDDDCDNNVPASENDDDGDGFRVCANDCNDGDAGINPGTDEVDPFCADGIDNDCDGQTDLTDPSCLGVCPDADGDGYAACTASCSPEAGDTCGDCVDSDPAVHPGVAELCNGEDDDCDGNVPADEADGDADGHRICAGDCNDADDSVHPGATEVCNGVDDDCANGLPANEADGDGDGVRVCQNDCNDGNPSVHPGVLEQCNGEDDDCDGNVPPTEANGDDDGFRICDGDCDDGNPGVRPDAPETCDGLDTNCDGSTPPDEADGDDDGYRLCQNDCNDADPAVNPGVIEDDPFCADGVDNDCDGTIDLQDPTCLGFCPDGDNDGYAVCDATCILETGDQCGDCNDTAGGVHPGANEVCNGIDDDCQNGVPANEADGDGDGFRVCQSDCDDGNPGVNPGATEQCNGIDDDCVNGVPTNEADADSDGFRVCQNDCNDNNGSIHPNAAEQCNGIDDDCAGGVPANETDGDGDGARLCNGECNDGDAAIHPGAVERCNGIDDDCNGGVPANEADGDEDGVRLCGNDCDDTDPNVNPLQSESGETACADTIDNDCDGNTDLGDVGCAVLVTSCASLGDQTTGTIDEDVWSLVGQQNETVTITLTANGAGSGRADLVLIDAMEDAVDLFRIDRTTLPNQITVTLPASGPYRIAVRQHPPGLLLPGSPFSGAYCLSVDASAGAAQTLAPTSSVEGAD